MGDARHELSMQLATGFAAIVLDYLPIMEESVRRSSSRTGFGVKVDVWNDAKSGTIRGRLSSSAPKIAAPVRPAIDFVLQMNQGGQLEFIFEGTPSEMRSRLAEQE